jgi:Flp pilus assembly protein TadG
VSNNRIGAAVIELAICIPVMVLLVYGTIEMNSSIFLKQTLTSAAHEGALIAMKQNATEDQVIGHIEMVLDSRNVSNYDVNLETDGVAFDDIESGDAFRIRISTSKSNQFIDLTQVVIEVGSQRP